MADSSQSGMYNCGLAVIPLLHELRAYWEVVWWDVQLFTFPEIWGSDRRKENYTSKHLLGQFRDDEGDHQDERLKRFGSWKSHYGLVRKRKCALRGKSLLSGLIWDDMCVISTFRNCHIFALWGFHQGPGAERAGIQAWVAEMCFLHRLVGLKDGVGCFRHVPLGGDPWTDLNYSFQLVQDHWASPEKVSGRGCVGKRLDAPAEEANTTTQTQLSSWMMTTTTVRSYQIPH